jgi:EF-P beta-lysylation protein EpmB
MIPHAAQRGQTLPAAHDWQQSLANVITDPAELLSLLGLETKLLAPAIAAAAAFRLKVPREFVARMQPGNAADPLLRQVLPLGEELAAVAGFQGDPLAEAAQTRAPGLLQKYRGRVLVIASGSCAVNCRYCFRREFPYGDNTPDRAQWQQLLELLAGDDSIEEVILSGGDPLVASNRRLQALLASLDELPHLRRLRIHTRLPVVIPARIDRELVDLLAGSRLASVMVIHANHANELDDHVQRAMALLADAGVHLLNQSVLLRGVNDSVTALTELSQRLFACRVLPYYLHLLDPVSGAAHFDVPEVQARQLVGAVGAGLPGYLVPRLVREIPGQPAKTLIAPMAG